MTELIFDVHGTPGAQGSKDGFAVKKAGKFTGKVAMVESSAKVKPWRSDVKAAAEAAMLDSDEWTSPCRRAVHLVVTFTFNRPRSHYRTGRFADVLRDDVPMYVTSRGCGDLDKIERATFDALTAAGVIEDDSLIVTVRASKIYGPRSGARIALAEVKTHS